MPTPANWTDLFTAANHGGVEVFNSAFLAPWNSKAFVPTADDKTAAAMLHIQLVSRIATQRLAYIDGEEATALTSLHSLFNEARDIFKEHPDSGATDAIAWHVMNTHVRPFTARWHRQRETLAALDATDIFRHELASLQEYLVRFDALLVAIRDDNELVQPQKPGKTKRENAIAKEMGDDLSWGIDEQLGGLQSETARDINREEREAVLRRRMHYRKQLDPNAAEETQEAALQRQPFATGLAISGGGIRSATFALGVLAALARRNLMYQFDYLSTVSGGGYLGSFLTTFLSASGPADISGEIGLARQDLPFRRDDGEAIALRHVRHHSRYLATGRLWERLQMAFAQVYGMAMNWLGFAYVAFVAAFAEYLLRRILHSYETSTTPVIVVALALATTPFVVPLIRKASPTSNLPDKIVAGLFILLMALLAWHALSFLHCRSTLGKSFCAFFQNQGNSYPELWLFVIGAIPLLASALLALIGNLPSLIRTVLIIVAALAAPLVLLGIELVAFHIIENTGGWGIAGAVVVTIAGLLLFWFLFDINFTSPHRLYKRKLGEAYLVQPISAKADAQLRKDISLKLSACNAQARAPYHLVNCALNVPGSQNSKMQGRLTDFFLFSRDFCGSPLTGYWSTTEWENLNPTLDLGTAMAISGAAAAPQMGLGTIKNLSFWLALFNVRLGYWISKPESDAPAATGGTTPVQDKPALSERISALLQAAHSTAKSWLADVNRGTPPGLMYLLREMFGWADETHAYVNVSDGGHIENLGVYELLRRRCKYIVAIDGEQDDKMTFQGLATLLRLAYIDLGITIDVGLDPLRVATTGYSHSHFAFCRIHYPVDKRGGEESYGYLIYLKLSLTGNEGEFIRRYKLDEPAFPHTSTANQFFSEAQFEAYRSLGEHVGDKMFLPAIVGEDMAKGNANVIIEKWFREIGTNMLEPAPK